MMYSAVYSVGAVDISFVEFTPLVLFCLVLGGDGGFGGVSVVFMADAVVFGF